MKALWWVLTTLSIVNILANSALIDVFLKDFFRYKNAVFSIANCWSKQKNTLLFQQLTKFPVFKPAGFYHNKDANDVKKWPTNSFLVLDVQNCETSRIVLDQLNESNTFVYPLKYLVLVENSELSAFSETLNQYQILPNCEFTVAVFETESESAVLYQIYKVGKINELTWENYGNWSLQNGLIENFWDKPTSKRRLNLNGANLVVCLVIFVNDTLNHLTDYKYPGVDTFTKQDYEPTMCMLRLMNINHSFSIVDNYGYKDEKTGIFGGLIRELEMERADVSAGSIFFTADRYAAVDLIKQGNPHAIRFIVRKPSTSFIKNIFFITFTTSVWIASIVILVVFALVVIVILNWEARHKERVKQDKYRVSDVVLISLEAVCQQGTTTEPQSFAGRILALILFGAFMFIYVSYSANIVVLLQSTTRINSIQELLDSRIEVGGEEIHYMKNYFEGVKKGPLKKLYDKKIYPNQYFPLKVGMEKVREGNFAFHVASQSAFEYILRYFSNHEICGLQELPGYIEENLGYLAVPKHSAYKELFKVAILRVDEYGLQRRTNIRVIMTPKCYSQTATFKSVGFIDCEQVIYIYFYGAILTVAIFLGEHLVHHFAKRVKRH